MDPVPHQLFLDPSFQNNDKLPPKQPVVRGARACTVCRAAKMKCVVAEEGAPCLRCKRSASECIFEKHKRGRKPGSKLSDASKMLRRLEKGLSTAKAKSKTEAPPEQPFSHAIDADTAMSDPYARLGQSSRQDEDDDPTNDDDMVPARLISQENRKSDFFKTILNPEHVEPATSARAAAASRSPALSAHSPPRPSPAPVTSASSELPALQDPIAAGLIDDNKAKMLFDAFFIRLNTFINLFDASLHSVAYVRARCPFLLTTILMAACKFFEPTLYPQIRRLAHDFAVRAFAEGWRRVEIVQAFACLAYWKEPEDTFTWRYIGYACRMAVDLDLNRYVGRRTPGETDLALRERRNRERSYLVLFVHDRSLSMQTGRLWMLPECELVRHAETWHQDGGQPLRQEDVIVAAFVQLRRIAAEASDFLGLQKGAEGENYDVLLHSCNSKLTQWSETWDREMQRANGEKIHFSIMQFFGLHVKLFLNSFGIRPAISPMSGATPSSQALQSCYTSAMSNLQKVAIDLHGLHMLRYGQDSITVMTAYSAVILLKLLRSHKTHAGLPEGAADEIHALIRKTSEAYDEAATPGSLSAAYHARFLRGLIANDVFKAHQAERETHRERERDREMQVQAQAHNEREMGIERDRERELYQQLPTPPPQGVRLPPHAQYMNTYAPPYPTSSHSHSHSPPQMYAPPPVSEAYGVALALPTVYTPPEPAPSDSDAHYWNHMFREIGFPVGGEAGYVSTGAGVGAGAEGYEAAGYHGYGQQQEPQQQQPPQHHHHPHQPPSHHQPPPQHHQQQQQPFPYANMSAYQYGLGRG